MECYKPALNLKNAPMSALVLMILLAIIQFVFCSALARRVLNGTYSTVCFSTSYQLCVVLQAFSIPYCQSTWMSVCGYMYVL